MRHACRRARCSAEALIPDLLDYLDQARHLEQQGEFVEALWCYESALRDPSLKHDPALHQKFAIGLSNLVLREASRARDIDHQKRLVDRAISALTRSMDSSNGTNPALLVLAEAHGLRFALRGEQKDLLAANLHLNTVSSRSADSPDAVARVEDLRSQLAAIAPPRRKT